MNPLIVLVAGLLLLYVGVTGRAEGVWQSLTQGINNRAASQGGRGGRAAPNLRR